MIWHLLWLYPLIGLGLGTYYAFKYVKHDEHESAGYLVFMLLVMAVVWPWGWCSCHTDIRGYVAEATAEKEREHEALLESIRRERYAPDPLLAEFDKELGIEPEPNHWRVAHPEASAEYDRKMVEARARSARLPMTVQQGYSIGGYIPTTTELKTPKESYFYL